MLHISQLSFCPRSLGRLYLISILWFISDFLQYILNSTQMRKEIFSCVPLIKKMQDGKAVYGVQLRLNGLEQTQQIWKTLPDYYCLEKEIAEIAFDFDRMLEEQLHKTSTDEQKLKIIVEFINQCKNRPDITNLISFREFFNLTDTLTEYLEEWNRVNVGVKDMAVVGCAWDAGLGLLFSLHRPHSKTKIITNFFKQLLSKQSDAGMLRLHRLTNKWTPVFEIALESQPNKMEYSPKSSMLVVSTAIGIFAYAVTKEGDNPKLELIDFAKIYNTVDFRFCAKSANVYAATGQKLYLHSINKEYTMEIGTQHHDHLASLDINRTQTRLYCSEKGSLKIFDISQTKNVTELASIPISDDFSRINACSEKYLFGVSKAGYISVFEIKPPSKERLMNVLTNIDCPGDLVLFAFHEKGQMIITSKAQYIVLISSKNIPLFAGGTHRSTITAGLFDAQSNLIVTADQEGNVIFYNLSFRITDQ